MSLQVNLSLKEIYKALCPKCKKKLEDMVKEKMSDQIVKEALEAPDTEGGR